MLDLDPRIDAKLAHALFNHHNGKMRFVNEDAGLFLNWVVVSPVLFPITWVSRCTYDGELMGPRIPLSEVRGRILFGYGATDHGILITPYISELLGKRLHTIPTDRFGFLYREGVVVGMAIVARSPGNGIMVLENGDVYKWTGRGTWTMGSVTFIPYDKNWSHT